MKSNNFTIATHLKTTTSLDRKYYNTASKNPHPNQFLMINTDLLSSQGVAGIQSIWNLTMALVHAFTKSASYTGKYSAIKCVVSMVTYPYGFVKEDGEMGWTFVENISCTCILFTCDKVTWVNIKWKSMLSAIPYVLCLTQILCFISSIQKQ